MARPRTPRVRGLTRRAGDLTLGPFTLDEFGAVDAAIISVASADDFLCFCWGESRRVYALESAVIVRARSAWVDALSEVSGITREKCANVLSDLELTPTRDELVAWFESVLEVVEVTEATWRPDLSRTKR